MKFMSILIIKNYIKIYLFFLEFICHFIQKKEGILIIKYIKLHHMTKYLIFHYIFQTKFMELYNMCFLQLYPFSIISP